MILNRTILAGLAALALGGTALATPNIMHRAANAMSGKTQDINMGAQNGSKQTGTARLVGVGGGVQVKVSLINEPRGASEPAHIHQGTCAKLNPAPWKPLSNVVGGSSTTVVKGITIDQLKGAHYAINVHASASNLKKYVSCGDLK